jgi:hypothetical protein
MQKKILFTFVFICLFTIEPAISQGIKGKVVDADGQPVAYASIFIRELTRGTTTNSLGLFSLPLPPGEYNIFFRSLGYTEVFRKVTVGDEMIDLQVVMPPQTYMIPEVRVSASGEDPAYRVMRKAIGLANYHLNQVATYDAEIYIKGTAYFHKLPRAIAKRIEVGDVKVEEDRAYMLESLNEVTYRAPDKYDMRIIASQNTIPGYVENVNPMDYINASLYQPQIESFVSPLARNAFFYYDFSFEGSFLQGNHMIDKIRVVPRRKSQQLCSGFLYIVEDLWCLHSSDLEVNTIAGTLYLEQQYANVIMDAWLPVSHKLDMEVQIAGVQADVTYVSSLKYTNTVLNPNLPRSWFEPVNAPVTSRGGSNVDGGNVDGGNVDGGNVDAGNVDAGNVDDAVAEDSVMSPSPEQEKIQEILAREELTDRDMTRLTRLMEKETEAANPGSEDLEVKGTEFSIAPNAVVNDSTFWNRVRPVPLTLEEQETISTRDSIYGFGDASLSERRDSLFRARRPGFRTRDLLAGKTFQSKDRKTRITYGGLVDPSMLSFNTVDGWKYGQEIGYDYRPTNRTVYRWNLRAGYGFARKAPDIDLNSSILYAPRIRGKIALRVDYRSMDFNRETGIPSLTNSAYSLLYRENYSKRYENLDVLLEHRMDLATGLVFYASADFQRRRELTNHSDFSFFYRNSKNYTENHPEGYDPSLPLFDDSNLSGVQIRLEYTHKYFYRLRNGRKQYFKSDYPTLYAVYRHAFPAGTTGWADYSLIYGGLQHEREVGLLSSLSYKLEYGRFLHTRSLHFSDLKHFKVSPLLFDMQGFQDAFLLMDYYRASTSTSYIEGHARLTSPFLVLKLLPWFSERLWNESVSVGYLNSGSVQNHIQVGYSLNEIGFLFDIGIYTAIENWKYHGTALRIYLRF